MRALPGGGVAAGARVERGEMTVPPDSALRLDHMRRLLRQANALLARLDPLEPGDQLPGLVRVRHSLVRVLATVDDMVGAAEAGKRLTDITLPATIEAER